MDVRNFKTWQRLRLVQARETLACERDGLSLQVGACELVEHYLSYLVVKGEGFHVMRVGFVLGLWCLEICALLVLVQ